MPGYQGLPNDDQSLPLAPAVLRSTLFLQLHGLVADGDINASFLLPLRNGNSHRHHPINLAGPLH